MSDETPTYWLVRGSETDEIHDLTRHGGQEVWLDLSEVGIDLESAPGPHDRVAHKCSFRTANDLGIKEKEEVSIASSSGLTITAVLDSKNETQKGETIYFCSVRSVSTSEEV